jgi:hypothetical protein
MRLSTIAGFLAVVVFLGVAGCANPFKDSYMSSLERWPGGEVSRLLPVQGEAKLITSTSMKEDAQRMMENGYLLLGRSKFRDNQVDPARAREVAAEIGASIILFERQYSGTVTDAVPMSEWIPEREVTIREQGIVQGGPDMGQVYDREVTRTVRGEFRTTYVPQTTEYYDFAATYWGKLKPSIFGVLVTALDDEARQRIQSNRGVVIRAVVKNTPAFTADLLRYDVITRFAGEDITDPDQFFDTVVRNAGRKVDVEINRNGVVKTIPVQLVGE